MSKSIYVGGILQNPSTLKYTQFNVMTLKNKEGRTMLSINSGITRITVPFEPVFEAMAEWSEKERGGKARKLLDVAPTAPIARCEWIESDHGSYICSACGEDWVLNDGTPEENHMNYCPRCGAIMEDVLDERRRIYNS